MSSGTAESRQTTENCISPILSRLKVAEYLGAKADLLQGWEWEILSCLVSLFALGLIVIMAIFLVGRSPTTWPMDLTPNTVVSLLGEVSKAAVLFPVAEAIGQLKWLWFKTGERRLTDFELYDLASRRPTGSVKLLLTPRLWNIVSLGALVTLLSIGLGPSLQQILTYCPKLITVDTAVVVRTDSYYGIEYPDIGSTEDGMIENKMRGAIYGGLFGVTKTPTPMYSPLCSTGNCTWDPYTSLGVCHRCQNISSAFQLNGSRDDKPNDFVAWLAPNGFQLNAEHLMKTSTVLPSLNYSALKNPIAVLFSAFFPPGSYGLDDLPTAHECVLFFCVRAYNAKSSGGVFSEEIIGTWPDPKNGRKEGYLEGPPLRSVNPTEWPNNSDSWSTDSVHTIRRPGDPTTYRIDTRTLSYLRDTLGWLLRVEHKVQNSWLPNDFSEAGQAIYSAMTENQSGSGLPDMIEKVAISMTNTIRNKEGFSGSEMSQQAIGSASRLETHIQIRWLWLLAAFGIVLLGCSFLYCTIRLTYKAHLSAWKSSSLAVMAIGLDEKLRSNLMVQGEALCDYERCARGALAWLSEPEDTEKPKLPDEMNLKDKIECQDTMSNQNAADSQDVREDENIRESLDAKEDLNVRESLGTRESLHTNESLDTRRT